MDFPEGKYAWMVKIGEKGQFVIPKEARELFGFHPGQTILVLADVQKGIAIPSRQDSEKMFAQMFAKADFQEE